MSGHWQACNPRDLVGVAGRFRDHRTTRDGRYIVLAYRQGELLNRPAAGWDDLADALALAMDCADDARVRGRTADAWVIRDRADDVDIVRVDIGPRIEYLA